MGNNDNPYDKKSKQCPLRFNVEAQKFPGISQDCIEEECAWYDEGAEQCIVMTIGLCLGYISPLLEDEEIE